MPSPKSSSSKNGKTPCQRSMHDWPVCYSDGCYLNRCCPVYRGNHPSPIRDYIPHPPVFILVDPFEAVPFAYHIPISQSDPE